MASTATHQPFLLGEGIPAAVERGADLGDHLVRLFGAGPLRLLALRPVVHAPGGRSAGGATLATWALLVEGVRKWPWNAAEARHSSGHRARPLLGGDRPDDASSARPSGRGTRCRRSVAEAVSALPARAGHSDDVPDMWSPYAVPGSSRTGPCYAAAELELVPLHDNAGAPPAGVRTRPTPSHGLDTPEQIAGWCGACADVAGRPARPMFQRRRARGLVRAPAHFTAFWCRALLGLPGCVGNPFRAHALVRAAPVHAAHFEAVARAVP